MASGGATLLSKEDLRDILECPICFNIPREGPIYQCENGHIVCKSCFPKCEKCPQCKMKMTKCRNLHLEKLIDRLPKKCRFKLCEFESMLNEVSIHEKSCEYRMIRCIYLHCNQMVPFIGMDEHLKESHLYDVIIKPYSENDSISLSKGYFGVMYKTLQLIIQNGAQIKNKFIIDCAESKFKIASCEINEFKHWISTDVKYAIWYSQKLNVWGIGNSSQLGSDSIFAVIAGIGSKYTANTTKLIINGPKEPYYVWDERNTWIIRENSGTWKDFSALHFHRSDATTPFETDFNFAIPPILLTFDGRQFYLEGCRDCSIGLTYVWISMLGTEKEADEYSFRYGISNPQKGQKLVYVGRVLSIDIPKSSILKQEMCLKIPDAMMKSLCEKNATSHLYEKELFPFSYKFVAKIMKTKNHPNMFENQQI